jgi:predicted O-methyltransferase YrrM
VIDNVFFFGRVWQDDDEYKNTPAIRDFNEAVSKDTRVEVCMIPASDGLIMCFVK